MTVGLMATGSYSQNNDSIKNFSKLANIPERGHLTYLVTTRLGIFALDSNKDLWLWKNVPLDPDGVYYD